MTLMQGSSCSQGHSWGSWGTRPAVQKRDGGGSASQYPRCCCGGCRPGGSCTTQGGRCVPLSPQRHRGWPESAGTPAGTCVPEATALLVPPLCSRLSPPPWRGLEPLSRGSESPPSLCPQDHLPSGHAGLRLRLPSEVAGGRA